MRIWYTGVFAVGAAALAAGALLGHVPESVHAHAVTADIVLVSGNPTSSAKAAAEKAKQWQQKTSVALQQLNTALNDFQAASQAEDGAGMQEACGRIGAAGQAIKSALPAPSDALTTPLSAAAANFLSAGSKCGALDGSDADTAQSVVKDLQAGIANVQTAQGAMGS